MEFGATTYALGFAAGALSTLSPCVLPLLPILVASAFAQHRLGLWALAGGLAVSFTLVGLFLATVGLSLGIDGGVVHRVAGALLIAFGAVMAVPALQRVFARASAGLADGGGRVLARVEGRGWRGQVAVGALLGVVWTPCVGPTLGAASTLAAQSSRLVEVAALMLVFGIGAASPLVAFGLLSRRLAAARSARWLAAAEGMRRVLGVLLVVVGLLIVVGAERSIETWLVDHSPDWLTALTTRL
jgi:cytochrome c biogenesis protein CcdA